MMMINDIIVLSRGFNNSKKKLGKLTLSFVGIILLSLSFTVNAQCVNPYVDNLKSLQKSLPQDDINSPRLQSENTAEVNADSVNGVVEKRWQANGNVVIRQNNKTIYTEQANGNIEKNLISLPSRFYIQSDKSLLRLDSGEYNSQTKKVKAGRGEIATEPFLYKEEYKGIVSSRGIDQKISFRGLFESYSSPSVNQAYFEDVTLTTCPPKHHEWQIDAGSLTANNDTQIGVARNIVLKVGKVPIFYLPYIDFPLDGRRKSGFLFPSVEFTEIDSDKGGDKEYFNLFLPYYINLAPNYDWTLTPKFLNGRGVLLNNDIRYLTEHSDGNVKINGITKDNQYDTYDYESNTSRYRLYALHNQRVNSNLSLSFLGNKVSDTQYLKDFSDFNYNSSTIHLPTSLSAKVNYEGWNSQIYYSDYQTLTENPEIDKPYVRKPQIRFSSPNYKTGIAKFGIGNIYSSVNGEWSSFTHFSQSDINRAWLYPKFSLQVNQLAGFFNMQLGWHLSRYTIDDSATTKVEKSLITRALPIFKVASGLIFERNVDDKPGWLQTLEPSVYWLRIPHKKQSDIPLIDSSRPVFQLSQLNTDNLFSGWDRISDANVLSYEINSRVYDQLGSEKFTLRFGQRYFVSESQVILPSEEAQRNNTSDFILSANVLLDNWRIENSWRYDSQESETSNRELLISYQPKKDRLIGARYIYQKNPSLPAYTSLQQEILSKIDTQEVVEGVIDWPLNDYIGKNISFTGRNYYSLADNTTLESQIALRYDSCCMGITLYRVNALIDIDQTYEQSWGIQFNLYGFGSLANRSNRDLDLALRDFRVR